MTIRPWEANWEREKQLAVGGQGTVFLARRVGSAADGKRYVLKTLNKPRDPERRERMLREIRALRALPSRYFATIVDGSTGNDLEDPLFLVTEFVEGLTIEDYVKRNGPMPVIDALDLMGELLSALASCHTVSIVHRDIKPDNVILRGAKPSAPCLIDFGLSIFLEDEPSITFTEQQIGNRFLMLPEHRTPGGKKRDPRSDLTACCGILFYCLTGHQPMMLEDEDGHPPHKRERSFELMAQIPAPIRRHLFDLFDKAFQPKVSERWQDIDDLVASLKTVRNSVIAHSEFCHALGSTDPDPWSDVLLWIAVPFAGTGAHTERRLVTRTYWLTRSGGDFSVLSERRGTILSGGARLWGWEASSTPVIFGRHDDFFKLTAKQLEGDMKQYFSKVAGHVNSARLIDLDTGEVCDLVALLPESLDQRETAFQDVEVRPLFSLGNLLFMETGTAFLGVGGAHPLYGADFQCIDLVTGQTIPWASAEELEALHAAVGNDAVALLMKEPDPWVGENPPVPRDLQISKYEPAYTRDCKLELEVLATTWVPYVFGDGRWGAYTRSAAVRTSELPQLLRPFSILPEAIRWLVGSSPPAHFGWSAIAPGRRDELLQIFRTREALPGFSEYSLHRL